MKQYKAIFIDWDDTIGDFINAAHCSLQDMFATHQLATHFLDFQTFYNIYHTHNISLWERYGRDEVTKEYLSFDRFFYPLMMAPVPYSLAEAIPLARVLGAEHLEHTTKYFRLLPDAEEVVRKLAERYPLTIVSNGFIEVCNTERWKRAVCATASAISCSRKRWARRSPIRRFTRRRCGLTVVSRKRC